LTGIGRLASQQGVPGGRSHRLSGLVRERRSTLGVTKWCIDRMRTPADWDRRVLVALPNGCFWASVTWWRPSGTGRSATNES